MAKRIIGCLMELDDKAKDLPAMLERMDEIKKQLQTLSGILKKMGDGRLTRNPSYWEATLNGWGKHTQLLANELTIIQTIIARHMIQ